MRRTPRYIRVLLATLLSMGLLLVVATGTAFAHAKVDSATPGIGSIISAAPTTVTVHTLENMKPGPTNSNLFVYSPAGDLISQGDATIGLNDPTHMSVKIKPSGDGVYVVQWKTVSADDGDPDQGAFTFTVKAGAAATTVATPVATAAVSATKPAATTGNSFPTLPLIGTAIVALIVGLGVGFGLGRNRPAPVTSTAASTAAEPKREETPTKQ